MKVYWGVQGDKRNTWLDFGSNLDHDVALAEVCTLWVLGIWWLSVDIWWWRNVIGWLSEWIQRLYFIKLPNSHVVVQHSTRCEDSCNSSLVQKSCWSTLAMFTETIYTRFVESIADDQDLQSPLGDKVSMLTHIYTHTKPGGRLKWSYAKSRGWQPTLCVAWCLICWFAIAYKKYGHTWHRMSLLRPGVIKQHKLISNQTKPYWNP